MASSLISLTIEEPTGVRRENWPVRWGVPFPTGILDAPEHVRLLGSDEKEIPCVVQETGRWQDGSVKWVLLDFQVTLEPQDSIVCLVEHGTNVARQPVDGDLHVGDVDDRIEIDTGPLTVTINREPFDLVSQVCLEGKPLLRPQGQSLWLADASGTRYDLANGIVHALEVEEANALRATVLARGTFGSQSGGRWFSYEVRITVHAALPWLEMELTYINTEDEAESEIGSIVFETAVQLEQPKTACCGSGRKIYAFEEPFYFHHESVIENYGVFSGSTIYKSDGSPAEGVGLYEQPLARGWLDVADARSGVCVSMRDFVALYPKEAAWDGDETVAFHIWPARSDALNMHQGMARTHALMVHFHDGSAEAARAHELAAAFEEPLLPMNGKWYLDSGAFGLVLPFSPDRYPAIERTLRDQTVQARNTRNLGMIDFGDWINPGTGSQGGFSLNNEPDRLHGFLIQHIRTGERIPWQLVESAVWHTVDVDFVHHTTRSDLELGGQRIHGHGHLQYDAEGYPDASTVPSHMWTEGLLEYYHLTGHRRIEQAALSIGNCFIKMVDTGWAMPPYHSNWHSARDSGWPLIGLSAVFEHTLDDRYREAMRRIFEAVRRAQHDNGGWSMELFFNRGFCPFQNAVCLTGLARYHEATGDPEAAEVFLNGARFLAGDDMRFPDGAWVYVTSHDYRSTYYGDSPVEPFGYAYHLTEDAEMIRKVLAGWAGNLDLRASPRFMWAADKAGLLRDG